LRYSPFWEDWIGFLIEGSIVKLSLCLTKQFAIKPYEGVDVEIHVLLILVEVGDE
jgi:hypothetical protein